MADQVSYHVLIDFDGVLCDMGPFAYELRQGTRADKWYKFFAHTAEAKPIPEGVALVQALARIGWRYSISSTRPVKVVDRSGDKPYPGLAQQPVITAWAQAHLSSAPPKQWIHLQRNGAGSAVECKIEHVATLKSSRCAVFIDDEIDVVDQLTDYGIPALHIADVAGCSANDLAGLLHYSRASADKFYQRHAATLVA